MLTRTPVTFEELFRSPSDRFALYYLVNFQFDHEIRSSRQTAYNRNPYVNCVPELVYHSLVFRFAFRVVCEVVGVR